VTAPLVSVIVPVYNGERYLRDALSSAAAQDYESLETVVVDDGSVDGTPTIAQAMPNVGYVRQPHGGLAAAKNHGISVARGDFITFLDADDVIPPDKVTIQVRYLVAHPHVGCVLGRQEIVFDKIAQPTWMTRDLVYGDLDGIPLVSAMFRRDVFDVVGGFDEQYLHAEDRDLFVRMREHGVQIEVLPNLVLRRRFHGSNMTGSHVGKHPMLRSLKAKLERERGQKRAEPQPE
jgi:glycosyltransferase involved in cell wall biosynthesis